MRPLSFAFPAALRAFAQRPELAALALVACVYAGTFRNSPYPLIDGDGHYTWLWARSLAVDFDLSLDNDAALCGDPWHRGVGPSGHALNQWPMGPALAWAPLLALARGAAALHLVEASAAELAACRGRLANFAMWGSVLAGLATLWLGARLVGRHASRGAAALAVLAVGLASPLPFYACLLPSYSHVHSALWVAIFVERWDAFRGAGLPAGPPPAVPNPLEGSSRLTPRRGLVLGLVLGAAMLMRTQNAILAVLPLADELPRWLALRPRRDGWKALRGALGPLALVAFGALLIFSAQLFASQRMYGTPFIVPQGSWYLRWRHPALGGLLFSSYNGLLTTTPLCYPAVAGLLAIPFWRRHRALWPLTLFFVLSWYVNACVWDYWGEASFSARRLTDLAAPFALGFGLCADWLLRRAEQRPRAVAASAACAAIFAFALWNSGAMDAEASGRLRQRGEHPAPFRWTPTFELATTPLWRAVGNPLAWPASLPWALRYRMHPRAYDQVVGEGFFKHHYLDRTVDPGADLFPFDGPDDYFAEGFSAPQQTGAGRGRAVSGHARFLLPLFADDVAAVELAALSSAPAPSRVTLRWNGVALPAVELTGAPSRARLELPPGTARVRENELELEVTGAPALLVHLRLIETAKKPDHF